MTETTTPSTDRSGYLKALEKLDAAVCEAIAVGQASSNRMVPANWRIATQVFARLCGAGQDMVRAAPLSRWVRSDFENWDFGSVASHGCGVLDGSLLFFYLVEPPKSDSELRTRIDVMNINDCSRRIELHKNLGLLEDVVGFKKQKSEIQQRLKSNLYFRTLSKSFQQQCLDGSVLMIDSRDQVLAKLGFPKNNFNALYDLWNQHSRILPMSFYRMEANGRGTGLENEVDRTYLIQALEVCAAFLSDATDRMVEQFPDVADARRGIESQFQPGPVPNCPKNSGASEMLERDRPAFVKRFMIALGKPGITRMFNDPAIRELAEQRSRHLVNSPWGTELSEVGQSREFTFLRDFWNTFQECTQSCQALDLIRDLSLSSMKQVEPERHTVTATYWMESYLNEVYIFQLRLLDLITFIQRRYKKDADFTEFVNEVGDSLSKFVTEGLEPLINDRGAHVHQQRHRHSDPALARLSQLDTMIDILGHSDLRPVREKSRKEATTWLTQQLSYYSEQSWQMFDDVCRGFSEGLLLGDNRIIIPMHHKDNPEALQKNT